MPGTFYASYAGGMNATKNPRLLAEGQLRLLVNGTVRDGWAAPRPPFMMREMIWQDERAQSLWENGVCQGGGVFQTAHGASIIFCFDGRLLRLNLERMECGHVFPEGSDYTQPLFNPRLPFAYLQQRGGWMVAQDGTSRPVLVGDTAVIRQKRKSGMMRTGTLMADGWGRLAVADHSRRRIYFSDHEFDPNSDALSFTEENAYFKNARYFEVPATLGRIVAMQFGPSLNGNDDKGPLLVFCEMGTRAYNVSVPRDQWISTDISATILPKVGACAHQAVVARGNDVVFSDHAGRIQSLASAISRQQDARIDPIDAAVWPLYRDEDPAGRRYRCAVEFDNRVLVSVQPERMPLPDGRARYRHRGIMALQGDPAVPIDPVWDGLWTGIFPVWMGTAILGGGRQACFILSLDSDGRHRLYELGTQPGYDAAPEFKAPPMLASLRPTDMELPFRSKPWEGAAMRLGDERGPVTVRGWWQHNRVIPAAWFTHQEITPACIDFSGESIRFAADSARPRLNLPRPPAADFYEAGMIFEVTGQATLQEVVLESGEPKSDPNTPNVASCDSPSRTPAQFTCPPDPFAYDLQAAPTIQLL